jgi:hypothetical protein
MGVFRRYGSSKGFEEKLGGGRIGIAADQFGKLADLRFGERIGPRGLGIVARDPRDLFGALQQLIGNVKALLRAVGRSIVADKPVCHSHRSGLHSSPGDSIADSATAIRIEFAKMVSASVVAFYSAVLKIPLVYIAIFIPPARATATGDVRFRADPLGAGEAGQLLRRRNVRQRSSLV